MPFQLGFSPVDTVVSNCQLMLRSLATPGILALKDISQCGSEAKRASHVFTNTTNLEVVFTVVSETKPLEIPPLFSSKLIDQEVTDTDSVTLTCEVTGSPMPTVTWFKASTEIKNSRDLCVLYNGRVAKLEIAQAYVEDTGEYSCVATNVAGKAVCSAKVTVKGRPVL